MRVKTLLIATLLIISTLSTLAQIFEWVKQMGGKDCWNEGNSIAVDDSGNVYTTGKFVCTVDFDPGPGIFTLTTAGHTDIFVQKLNANGDFVWTKQIGGISFDYGHSIDFDNYRNLYIAGRFRGTVDFDPGPGTFDLTSVGNTDMFVQKLDANGDFVWAKRMGGTDAEIGIAIDIDDSQNVYTTGSFQGTADFDPGPATYNLTSNGVTDIFIQKLDANGNFVWANQIGGVLYDEGSSITVDSVGNAYVTGSFHDTVDFDPGVNSYNLISAGKSDIFIQKLDFMGNLVWVSRIGGVLYVVGSSIALDTSGYLYFTGCFQDTADFDPGTVTYNLTSVDSFDIFVQKLDTSGNFVWVRQMGGTGHDIGRSIALDVSGNAYITGHFEDTVDFNPGSGIYNLTSIGLDDIFIQKLDASGNFAWAKKMGGPNWDVGNSITVDVSGNVYSTGRFQGTVDFDPSMTTSCNLTSIGINDIFVQKLSPCKETSSTINEIACNGYTSPSSKYVWKMSGNYMDTITNSAGCDSIITVNLTINTVDTSITQAGAILSSNAPGATYQWLDCNDGYSIITSETNQSFTATINGSYAVEVSQNGCVDTSDCYEVIVVGVLTNSFPNEISLYPNPTEGDFTIDLGSKHERIYVTVTDINGKEINNKVFRQQQLLNLSIDKAKGIYIVKLESQDKQAVIRVHKH